jgi:hypothetical protein
MKSLYADRDTVGTIYQNAQFSGEKQVITGDMNYELRKSLVDDLNETIIIATKEFESIPFYITVHEKKDLQMKSAILRRMIKTKYRPYPEDDTLVFYINPVHNEVYFCWCLPHWSEMDNILANHNLYEYTESDRQYVARIRDWKNMRLEYFGFCKNAEGNWMANPNYLGDELLKKQEGVKPSNIVTAT